MSELEAAYLQRSGRIPFQKGCGVGCQAARGPGRCPEDKKEQAWCWAVVSQPGAKDGSKWM